MKIFRIVISFIFVLGLNLLLGFILRPISNNVLEMVLISSTIILCILILYGVFSGIRSKIKQNKKNFHKSLVSLKEDVIKYSDNLELLDKKVSRTVLFAKIYYFAIFLLSAASGFSYMALLFNGIYEIDGLILFNLFIQAGFIANYLIKNENITEGFRLSEEEYPVIYELLRKATTKLNNKKNFSLYLTMIISDNSVIEKDDEYHILININLISILNKEELYSLILSLVASSESKIKNNKYKQEKIDDKLAGVLVKNNSLFFLNELLFYGARKKLEDLFKRINIIASKAHVLETDKEVLKHVNINDFASALIKNTIFELFYNEPGHKFLVPIYEEPSISFFDDIYENFVDRYKRKKNTYHYIIKNEITHVLSSKVLTKERLKTFDLENIEIDFNNRYYDQTESRYIINNYQRVDDIERERYYVIREQSYLPLVRAIENFDENPSDDLRELIDHAFALYNIEKINEAFEVFKYILTKYPDTSQAHFGMASYYLSFMYDKEGIKHMYRAVELNNNYIDNLDILGYFLLKMGLKEEFEIFDKFHMEKLEKKIKEIDDLSLITTKNKLFKPNLDESILEDIITYAKNLNFAKEIFIVRKKINDETDAHIVCVYPDREKSVEEVDDAMDSLFKNLDLREEQYGLTYIPSLAVHKRLKKEFKPYKFTD